MLRSQLSRLAGICKEIYSINPESKLWVYTVLTDGTATLYPADYDAYLYRMEQEVDEEGADGRLTAAGAIDKQNQKKKSKRHRDNFKKVASLERTIAQLDERKQTLNAQLLATAEATEAQRLYDEIQRVQAEIDPAEERWFDLHQEKESDE